MPSSPSFRKKTYAILDLRPKSRLKQTASMLVFGRTRGIVIKRFQLFLKGVKGKEIFLFGTAGFGGSQEYFDKILDSVQKHIDRSNTVIGTFMCQGKMPASVRERYVKMKNSPLPIPNIDKMIENFDKAISHPDYEDIDRLKGSITQV